MSGVSISTGPSERSSQALLKTVSLLGLTTSRSSGPIRRWVWVNWFTQRMREVRSSLA